MTIMKIPKRTLPFLLMIAQSLFLAGQESTMIPDHLLNNSHDINSLGQWGPYSKQYAGISHIEDIGIGIRVDFSVIPGLYRRNYSIPDVLFESGWHPWKVSPEMDLITYRYDLEWKDKVYVDVTYEIADSSRVKVYMKCVNNSDITQNLLLHNTVSVHYDENHPRMKTSEDIRAVTLYGCDYEYFEPAVKSYDYNLVYDGWMRGEELDPYSLSGSVLGKFGNNAGDRAMYIFDLENSIEDAKFYLRCKIRKGGSAKILAGGCVSGETDITGSGEYEIVELCSGKAGKGRNLLEITSITKENVKIDAIFITAAGSGNISIEPVKPEYRPDIEKGKEDFTVKYRDTDNFYGISWNYARSEIKEYENSSLDVFMRETVHRHTQRYFTGDREGHFTSAFLRPVILRAHTDTTIAVLLVTGDKASVRSTLNEFHTTEHMESGRKEVTVQESFLEQSAEYAFGQQLLEATLLTNVVYPVYTQKEFIRHFTPGKNWNSLYTWDLGCIALGMNEIDPVKAFEIIRAYTTDDDSQSAFIHHGTPLPIQFFAFSELANRVHDRKALDWLYHRLKRYYSFMMGRDSSSTTIMKSGMIRTWDYFYNSGGWDDYPPQHRLRTQKELYPYVAPCVSSSYYLRAAKILRMYAAEHGYKKDISQYDKDIETLSKAIQNYAWDEDAGYYSYVIHNKDGKPSGFFRDKDGTNFNMGLDGVSPLVGGCCNPTQTERLIENIFSREKLWTEYGISTVDQSASYYDPSGYWNGCVWIPHQYFIWKSLLDNNRAELAERLAFTALDTWNRECNESHYCFEHFIISSGRGAGWHNFSGLSSPLINLFNSYFKTGHIATGFDTAVYRHSFGDCHSSLDAELGFEKLSVGKERTIIVCLNPEYEYEAFFNGKKAEISSPYDGLLYITVCPGNSTGKLKISPVTSGRHKTEQ